MRDRSYHHGDLRAALLARAGQTLQEKGADALSLRELARDLGVSHAAPSRHFKDRRALLDALALNGFDQLTEVLVAAAPSEGTFRDRLAALTRAGVGFAVAEPELMIMMFSRKHDSDAAEEVQAAWLRLAAPVFAVIEGGQRSGDVHEGDLERIAVSVFIVVHGVASLTAAGVLSDDETPHALDDAIEHLIRGLKPLASADAAADANAAAPSSLL